MANNVIFNDSNGEIFFNNLEKVFYTETITPPAPSYVTSGLIMYIDAGDPTSYPGSGTNMTDISPLGTNSATMPNGGTYSASSGGVIQLNGTNQYIRCSTYNSNNHDFTIMGATRYIVPNAGRSITCLNNNWLVGHWQNYSENYYAEGAIALPAGPYNSTDWRIYTANGIIGGMYNLYVNDIFKVGNSAGSQGPNGWSIGSHTGGDEFGNIEFGFLMCYDRILDSTEMTTNFDYFKARYGL